MIPANNFNYNWNKYFTISEISEIIGVERSAVYRLIKNNKINASLGSPIKVSKKQLQNYVLKKAPKAPVLWEVDKQY
jgi:excisionase family DNA binding protein